MIPNRNVVMSEGDIGGEKIDMSFDQSSVSHLLSILTDLYSDPELAIIREYLTNSLDSHKAAGTQRPIEVTTPTRLSPFFKIKDYGLGMNASDIRETYSKYGTSTKRESNHFNGILGIGAKSALTYTSQFTLIGIKDGVKIQVSITRSSDGGGQMQVINESVTDLPNGVEISIPAKTTNRIHEKTVNFLRFWNKKDVLLNGLPLEDNGLIHVDENLFFDTKADFYSPDVMVMGGVTYPLKDTLAEKFRRPAVLFVPIGSVDFAPSREALHFTAKTIAFIDQSKSQVETIVDKYCDNFFSDVKNYSEAWLKSQELNEIFYQGKTEYKGITVPQEIKAPHKQVRQESTSKTSDYLSSKYFRIAGFKPKSVTATHRLKIQQYKEDHHLPHTTFALFDEKPDDIWLKDLDYVNWQDIAQLKVVLPDKPTKQSIEVYDFEKETYTREIPAGKKLVYWSQSKYLNSYEKIRYKKYLKDAVGCKATGSRIPSLEKKYNAIHYKRHIINQLQDQFNAIPNDVQPLVNLSQEDFNWAVEKNIDDYDDPDLKNIISRYQLNIKNFDPDMQNYLDIIKECEDLNIDTSSKVLSIKMESVLKRKYEFVTRIHSIHYMEASSIQSLQEAINALYHVKYKGEKK